MANHKSSLKRIRQEEKRRLHNRYYAKTMRNTVKKLRATTDKAKEKNTLRKQAKLRLGRIKARPVRLSVRTQDFHS